MVVFEPGRMTRSASPGSAVPGCTRTRSTVGFRLQRIEIVEIGDLRQDRHGDLELRALAPRLRMIERQRILGRQMPRVGKIRHEAERRPAGRRDDRLLARDEQARIAAKLVDDEARDQRRVVGIEHRLGADEARDHAAAVDVADDDDRHVGGAGKAHVGDVVAAQVDLRRAAGALDQHQIGLAPSALEALEHIGQQLRPSCAMYSAALAVPCTLPCTTICEPTWLCGLSRIGIHVNARRHAGGARLQRLGAADLAAVGRDRGVVRHVLRLERPHPQPALGVGARQPRDDAATCRRPSRCPGT